MLMICIELYFPVLLYINVMCMWINPRLVLNALFGQSILNKYIYIIIDQSRALKWNGQKKKYLMRLPPDNDSLNLHIMCANY